MGITFDGPRAECSTPGCRGCVVGATDKCRRHDAERRRAARRKTFGTTRVRKLTDEQVAEARRMRAAFKSHGEIAAHLGVSVGAIEKRLRRTATGRGGPR
jgi:hypothetical protein